ncbi:MAG: DUF63 family protein [Candidatus Micrarchaeota archaeon]|nr:DUF63 family protein [Candidatus Micrarchaeota archaeon]
MGVFEDYFISPIVDKTGYNAINTLAYAALAIGALYLIWRFMKGRKYDFSSPAFLHAAAAFVLFGSTCRVLTDLSDAGAVAGMALSASPIAPLYMAIHSSGIFRYGFLTVTPGIYLVTAALFLLSLAIARAMKQEMFAACAGFLLWLPIFLLVMPFMSNWMFFALAIAIAALGAYAAFFALERLGKMKLSVYEKLAIGGQALDGAATFVVLDIFSKETGKGYFEQHVLSSGIGNATPLGFFLFFLIKIALAGAIVYFLRKEKMEKSDIALVLIVVAIMGFAPGIRDALRMLCGT